MTDNESRAARRTVLKGLGVSLLGLGGAAGVTSAHHVAEMRGFENLPSEVVAGEPFTFDILWTSGHGAEACFVAAVSADGSDWTKIGKTTDTADYVGQDVSTAMEATVPLGTEAGDYTLRVSSTEAIDHCPNPGETGESGRFYVRAADVSIPITPPVEVADVQFKGCSEVWVAFEKFPVDSTGAAVNVNGNWETTTIAESELGKIPGHYGHDTPVYKHKVNGNDKLVGLRLTGDEWTNDNRCAKNV